MENEYADRLSPANASCIAVTLIVPGGTEPKKLTINPVKNKVINSGIAFLNLFVLSKCKYSLEPLLKGPIWYSALMVLQANI